MKKLIVIYYHDIVEAGKGFSYQRVEKEKFEQQMRYLKDHGYQSILFEDMDKPLPDKAILITFDDGFATVYENAAPIMKKYGMKGNVYLPTKYVEENEKHFMTWEMLKELCDSGQFSVAAHTHTHVDIRTLDATNMKEEMGTSNRLLRERIGIETKSFCMPYGKYDKKSIALLKRIGGYRYLFTSFYGHANERNLGTALIPRIGISNDDSMEVFQKKLEGKLNWKGPIQRLRLFVANRKGERITQYDI